MTAPWESASDWDRRVGGLWAKILLVVFFVPFLRPISGGLEARWSWEVLRGQPVDQALLALSPYLYAVVVLLALRSEDRRKRGTLVMLGAIAVFLCTAVLTDYLLERADRVGELRMPADRVIPLLLGFFGAALIAAGNRQQKHTLDRSLGLLLTVLGGLCILGFFFAPVGKQSAFAMVKDGDAWKEAWPINLWLVGLAVYGFLGLISPIGNSDDFRVWISRLARLLGVAFPIAIVVVGLSGGGELVVVLTMVVKTVIPLLALAILFAVGLARAMEG